MKSIYVTASNRWTGLYFASILRLNNFLITSVWHNEHMTRTSELSSAAKAEIANQQRALIAGSSALVVVSDPDMVPGGKFVDVGIALGHGIKVILVGRRENLKMWDSAIVQCDDIAGVFRELT